MLALSSHAAALGLQYYGIDDTINNDLSVTNNVTFKFDSPITHLDYNLDFEAYDLTYDADFDFADCSIKTVSGKSRISCDFIGMTKEKNTLRLSFKTKNMIRRVDDGYRFTVNYGISLPIKRSFVLIRIPQNAVLATEVANQSYYPSTGKIITDGKHIIVYWEDFNLTSGDKLQFSILYKMPLVGGPLYNFLIASMTFIVIIVMIAIAVYIRKGASDSDSVQEVVKSVLNKDEKKIVDILTDHEGRANQKYLVRESGFSKAKVSRIVKNLKSRGIVEIEPVSGRENRVILRIEKHSRESGQHSEDQSPNDSYSNKTN